MKSLLRCSLLLIMIAPLQAQTDATKYLVIKTEDGDAYFASLNRFADQGYRILTTSKYTLLRRDATPPDTYRYLRLEVKGGPTEFTNWINEQGARGYRWIPRTSLLEKAPHPRNYEYRNSPHGALGPSKGRDLSSVVAEGYQPVGIVVFSHALGAVTKEVYFEREVGKRGASSGSTIEVSDAMRAGNVLKHVNELGKQGYRFLAPHDSNKGGGIAVMMQKCSDDCAGRYEYLYFDAKDVVQVQKDLNTLGTKGFRVAPASLDSRPHLLERDTRERRTYSYRAIDSPDATSLQRALIAADQEEYTPIGFVWHSGWTAQGFLLLEKDTTAASVP